MKVKNVGIICLNKFGEFKMKKIICNKETPAANERFHASGGVCPQTILCEFASASPARTFVNPRLREAAGTLGASKYTSFVFLEILGFCSAHF
jgi:hypothetical protein